MRILPLMALFAAACGSTRGTPATRLPDPSPTLQLRVVLNQYRGENGVFVIENLAGRNEVELRSEKLPPGATPVAYVPDEILERLFREFRRAGWNEYAIPRPANPINLGASGEISVIEPGGRTRSLLRIRAPGGGQLTKEQTEALKAYVDCTRNFMAVWGQFPPRMQATTSATFGVKRAENG